MRSIERRGKKIWLRGLDLNQRPSGYEPDELPDCSTPRDENTWDTDSLQIEFGRNAVVFRRITTSLRCERENPCRHGQLVGPGFSRAVVSEETAGGRAVALVCAAFRLS